MLEYEPGDGYKDFFGNMFCLGYQEGYLMWKLISVKDTLSAYSEDQIHGKMTKNNNDQKLFRSEAYREWLENYYDFFIRYGNLSKNAQIKRYIAETEFLPWR